jgi:AraC-like DNA-binding protein/mannose-6-phosphate isomerase-like protein (cupin superfamily)
MKQDGFINQKAIVIPPDVRNILAEDSITRLLYITDIGYYPNADEHYRHRKDGSSQNILIYCADGEGWYSINNQRFTVRKNQFFIISAGTPHTYAASVNHPWSIYWVHFTGEMANAFNSLYNKTHTIDNASNARYDARIQLFDEIFQNLEMGYNIDNLEYSSIVLWHFLGSMRYIPQFRIINQGPSKNVINDAISFMKNNISKKLTLEEIAQHVNYSPSHFGNVFAQRTGFTPLNYFNQLKIQAACRYLDFSDMKIKEIAYNLGFYDQYHFSKVFSKLMEMTPTQYRAKNKG